MFDSVLCVCVCVCVAHACAQIILSIFALRGRLSGYLGTPEQGQRILELVDEVKAANPNALYCCDPVMGHPEKGCIVSEGVSDFFREHAVQARMCVCVCVCVYVYLLRAQTAGYSFVCMHNT